MFIALGQKIQILYAYYTFYNRKENQSTRHVSQLSIYIYICKLYLCKKQSKYIDVYMTLHGSINTYTFNINCYHQYKANIYNYIYILYIYNYNISIYITIICIYIYTYYTNVQQPLCRRLALLGRLSSLPKGLPATTATVLWSSLTEWKLGGLIMF